MRITEVSEGGSVPDLRVANLGDLPLLLLDGEQMVGAKQNRILNMTVLVAALRQVTIPVSCVDPPLRAQRLCAVRLGAREDERVGQPLPS